MLLQLSCKTFPRFLKFEEVALVNERFGVNLVNFADLFQQTISISGSIFSQLAQSETTIEDSLKLAETVGCRNERSKITRDCMKKKNIVELMNAVNEVVSF